jgi:hypothetical protein
MLYRRRYACERVSSREGCDREGGGGWGSVPPDHVASRHVQATRKIFYAVSWIPSLPLEHESPWKQ